MPGSSVLPCRGRAGRILPAAAALLWAAAALPASAAEPAPPLRTVQAPHYGDVLFQFFQDKPFPALTSLMVSQHFQRMPRHEDEAEMLRGGLLLGYGLSREAGEIFERLAGSASPAVRDRAWFFLARLRYQRGEAEAADAALARIGAPLPGLLEEERLLLAGQVRLALGDTGGAADALRALLARPPQPLPEEGAEPGSPPPPKRSIFARVGGWLADAFTLRWFRSVPVRTSNAAHYARYNLGIALIRGGDVAGGRAALDELGRTPMHDEEGRSLRDQANVALGYAALADEDPEAAAQALERVRLQGSHSNKALLGFGWAAAAQDEPEQALVPWMELAGRDPSDPAVLEARIAVPYALAEAGAYGQALTRYEEALAVYAAERRALDESIASIRGGEFVDALLQDNPPEELGWARPLQHLPEVPHRTHLAPVLASHAFQEAFKNHRDLVFLASNLDAWQERLAVYGDTLDHRQRGFSERLPQVRERAAGLHVDGLQARRDALAGELAAASEAADGLAFATGAERAQWQKIERARRLLDEQGAALGGEVDVPAVHERLRRLQGALTWQLAQQYPERRWAADKGLQRVEESLGVARERDASLAAAQREEPVRFQRFTERLAALAQRIRALQPRLAELTAEQRVALQTEAVAALQAQQQRLDSYADQARYAVAQLYDRATQPAPQPKEGDRGQP